MDKEEFRIKLEEINHLVEKQDYKGAMSVVDSIDWRRVKNVRTLCVVGEIYAANKRYEDSKEIFLLAYHRASIGKNILYRLIEVSLKMDDVDEAIEFYEEYKEVAPHDNTLYILRYKILKAKKSSLSEQIKVLEQYKEKEFTERWSYELASLYYRAGEKEKCLELCNDIILWFSEGSYVMKAFDLKMRMGALTGEEREKYEQRFVPKLRTPEEVKALKENVEEDADSEAVQEEIKKEIAEEKEEPYIESIQIRNDRDLSGAETLQEKISKGIRDIFAGSKKKTEDEEEEEASQEEMIKTSSVQEDFGNVPDLEQEGEKAAETAVEEAPVQEEENQTEEKPDFSSTMKMPELNIPASMKNIDLKDALVTPEIPSPNTIFGNMEEAAAASEKEEVKDFDFNLEDTILAAASAQGIEIPDNIKESAPSERKAEPLKEEPEVPEKTEEEEILTEEDLQEAEAEFLNGPSGQKVSAEPEEKEEEQEEFYDSEEYDKLDDLEEELSIYQKPAKPSRRKEEVPALEPEEIPEEAEEEEMEEASGKSEESSIFDDDDDEFIAKFLKIAMEEEKQAGPLTEEDELEKFIESIQPKDERDPLDIIPRKKELSEDEKKLFTYFVKVPGMKEQLLETLCDVQEAAADSSSNTGNIIVMGGRETGKTRLISSLIPAICKELNLEASKVAYVFAEQINGKDIFAIADKLAGGFLVIEDANQLTPETVSQLEKVMNSDTDGMIVIIEDEKIGMRKLIAKYPKFAKKFTSMINIPVFTNDELVNFARVYTKENGYKIDQMGMLALYNMIGMNQKEDEPMNIGAVKNMIDNAIAKSQGGIRKFKRNISKKHVDRDGFVVLYEKDFN